MDIDFDNLTDEMKAELKKHVDAFEDATGFVAFDPNKPLSRSAQEQLKLKATVDGEEVETTVWDAKQKFSMAKSVSHDKREAKLGVQARKAFEEFRSWSPGDPLPSDDVLQIVANEVGMSLDGVKQGLTATPQDPASNPKPKDDKTVTKPDTKTGTPSVDLESDEFQAAVEAAVNKRMSDKLLPSKWHGQYLDEGLRADSKKALADEVDKALLAYVPMKELREKLKDNPQRTSILDRVSKIAKSTVTKQAEGRIREIANSGKGDIMEEIPGITKDVYESLDVQDLLDQVAPQPIVFGASESDEALKILSDEEPKNLNYGDPGYEENEVKIMARRAAELATQGT